MINNLLATFLDLDRFAFTMMALVIFIGLCVFSFSRRYLKGDAQYTSFCTQLLLLVIAICAMVCVDNLLLVFIASCISNMVLVRLMIHKYQWAAARASGMLAAKNFILGAIFLGTGFLILYGITGESSIKQLVNYTDISHTMMMRIALILLMLGAMAQSAIWPFHRWLLSSLNSPTPVSAIMHAGLVNGGGVLLVRFAPLYLQQTLLLDSLFVIGLMSVLLGTFWKLLQNDIKRMLACSTMGQMGFMLVQCGLGLFPAAVAHLVWHGMFKAYLFLASGGAAQEKRFDLAYPPKFYTLMSALLLGLVGTQIFAYITDKSWATSDSSLVLLVVCWLTIGQLVLPLLRTSSAVRLPQAFLASVIGGLVYGSSVQLITWLLAPLNLMQPQPLNLLHISGMVALCFAWLAIVLSPIKGASESVPQWLLKAYVAGLNAGQPHPATVTAHRNHYKY